LESHVRSRHFYQPLPIDKTVAMNPGGRKSGLGTPYSVSDVVEMETKELLRLAIEEGKSGVRKHEAFKMLVRSEILS
jgi:hypothetical protein